MQSEPAPDPPEAGLPAGSEGAGGDKHEREQGTDVEDQEAASIALPQTDDVSHVLAPATSNPSLPDGPKLAETNAGEPRAPDEVEGATSAGTDKHAGSPDTKAEHKEVSVDALAPEKVDPGEQASPVASTSAAPAAPTDNNIQEGYVLINREDLSGEPSDTPLKKQDDELHDQEVEHFDPNTPPARIQAYARLEFPFFNFYIQKLSVTIGRRPPVSRAGSAGAKPVAALADKEPSPPARDEAKALPLETPAIATATEANEDGVIKVKKEEEDKDEEGAPPASMPAAEQSDGIVVKTEDASQAVTQPKEDAAASAVAKTSPVQDRPAHDRTSVEPGPELQGLGPIGPASVVQAEAEESNLERSNGNDGKVRVDVDLGPIKAVSRDHARLFFDSSTNARTGLTNSWSLEVKGRNGLVLDGQWRAKGEICRLNNGSRIQIAERIFHFVLPHGVPYPAAPPSPSMDDYFDNQHYGYPPTPERSQSPIIYGSDSDELRSDNDDFGYSYEDDDMDADDDPSAPAGTPTLDENGKPIKRKRGRPRKQRTADELAAIELERQRRLDPTIPRRPRGRPPKHKTDISAQSDGSAVPQRKADFSVPMFETLPIAGPSSLPTLPHVLPRPGNVQAMSADGKGLSKKEQAELKRQEKQRQKEEKARQKEVEKQEKEAAKQAAKEAKAKEAAEKKRKEEERKKAAAEEAKRLQEEKLRAIERDKAEKEKQKAAGMTSAGDPKAKAVPDGQAQNVSNATASSETARMYAAEQTSLRAQHGPQMIPMQQQQPRPIQPNPIQQAQPTPKALPPSQPPAPKPFVPTNQFQGKPDRPPYSYPALIAQAIYSTPNKQAPLQHIHGWIPDKYPFFRDPANAQILATAIKQNLAVNRAFMNIPLNNGVALWAVEPEQAKLFDGNTFLPPPTPHPIPYHQPAAASQPPPQSSPVPMYHSPAPQMAMSPVQPVPIAPRPPVPALQPANGALKPASPAPPRQDSQPATSSSKIPIVIASTPPSYVKPKPPASGSSTDPASMVDPEGNPPIVIHQSKMYLSPTVFSSLTAQQFSNLQAIETKQALNILQAFVVNYFKMELKKRKKAEKAAAKAGGTPMSASPSPAPAAGMKRAAIEDISHGMDSKVQKVS